MPHGPQRPKNEASDYRTAWALYARLREATPPNFFLHRCNTNSERDRHFTQVKPWKAQIGSHKIGKDAWDD